MNLCIIAVIVTYNRAEILPRCLDAVLSQKTALTEIIVVNNASTDATEQVLSQYPHKNLTVLQMAFNCGGAGGFYTGVAAAIERGADWIWLMDDDGFPYALTLTRLLDKKDQLDVLNPLVCVPDEEHRLSFGLRLNGKLTSEAYTISKAYPGGIVPDEINPFNGTLINANVVKMYGNIKPEMFIWGDEVEFVLRLLKSGAKVGTVTEATFAHPANRRKSINLGSLGTVTNCPARFSHFFYRNSGFYTLRYRGLIQALGKFVIYNLYFLISLKIEELVKFWLYYFDGMTNFYRLPPSREKLLSQIKVRSDLRP